MRILFHFILLAFCLLLSGCGSRHHDDVFVYGTAAYNAASSNTGVNPCIGYQGWSALRYGVGETLFRLDASMRPEPWLAADFSLTGPHTAEITLRPGICFSSGRRLDGRAVKESLLKLMEENRRAASMLKITSISCTEKTVSITSSAAAAAIPAALCDPAACIMDYASGQPQGTGPYRVQAASGSSLLLQRRENYWNGIPAVPSVLIKSITDSGTLSMALQSGELDAASGLSAAGLEYFASRPEFRITSVPSTRICQAAFNFSTPVLQDVRVRRAVSLAINRKEYAEILLKGSSIPAVMPFASGSTPEQDCFDLDKARALLAQAGWKDTDGDGYADRNGQPLTLRWLTYGFRPELPLLAEAAQNYLRQAGIRTEIRITDSFADYLQRGQWDIYAQTLIAAPAGDPEGYFSSYFAADGPNNYGHYRSEEIHKLILQLQKAGTLETRTALEQSIMQKISEDCPYFYISRMNTSIVTKTGVSGISPHPSDFYEITSLLVKK